MAYQVLARKYRPQVFEDVVAQDHVTRTLQNAIANDRVASGYLFCGPRGTGKTTTARILAKGLNCAQGPTPQPCGACDSCHEIGTAGSLDVIEIDAASNTSVDDVRLLREQVMYPATRGGRKIYIIDEVHRLSGAAFDALLKTLEEPPAHVVFVFATTEPVKVPETILSRTQRFDFKRVAANDLAAHLKRIAGLEKIIVTDAAVALLARKADGSVRDALSLLDQVAAFAGEKITDEDVVAALGLVDRQTLFSFCEAVAAQDSKTVLELTRQVEQGSIDSKDFLNELLDHFRILMLLAADKEHKSILAVTDAEAEEYTKQAEHFSVGDTIRLIKTTTDLLADLKSGLDDRLVLETGAVRMAAMESTVRFDEILAHLEQHPKETGSTSVDLFGREEGASKKKGDPITLVKKGDSAASPSPVSAPEYDRRMNLPQIEAGWPSFLNALKSRNAMLSMQLANAEIRGVSNNSISLVFLGGSAKSSMEISQRPHHLELIRTTLREHFKSALSVEMSADPAKPNAQEQRLRSRQPEVDVKRLIAESPRLQKLIEQVDGDVIGVKKLPL